MATYDYQEILDQTFPQRTEHKKWALTQYEKILRDFPNEIYIPLTHETQETLEIHRGLQEGISVLAEALSTAYTDLNTQHANEYRFAINTWQVNITTSSGEIEIGNPVQGKKSVIRAPGCVYNNIEFITKLSAYENMHFDLYTKGRFKLSAELTRLLFDMISALQNGIKYTGHVRTESDVTQNIVQDKLSATPAILFNGSLYTLSHIPYKFSNQYPEVVLK